MNAVFIDLSVAADAMNSVASRRRRTTLADATPPDSSARGGTVTRWLDTLHRVTRYVDSEVGRLDTVLLHRPGLELARLTPRNNDSLLFDGIPWVGRAQEEHDIFAEGITRKGEAAASSCVEPRHPST